MVAIDEPSEEICESRTSLLFRLYYMHDMQGLYSIMYRNRECFHQVRSTRPLPYGSLWVLVEMHWCVMRAHNGASQDVIGGPPRKPFQMRITGYASDEEYAMTRVEFSRVYPNHHITSPHHILYACITNGLRVYYRAPHFQYCNTIPLTVGEDSWLQ